MNPFLIRVQTGDGSCYIKETMKLKMPLLLATICLLSAAPDAIDLVVNGQVVCSCQSFVSREGVTYLPLSQTAAALKLKSTYDPEGRIIILKTPGGPTVIDQNATAVGGTVIPHAHPPLWTKTDVFLPDDFFTGPLSRAMKKEVKLVPQYPAPLPVPEAPPEPAPSSHRNPVDVITLDPGHGGADLGAKGPDGLLEKNVTLAIALKLRDELRKHGLTVHMTREDDRQLRLGDRPVMARQAGADLLVSIHANGFKELSAQGFETFFASLTATDQAASDLARWENQEIGGDTTTAPISDIDAILGDMAQAEALADSQRLAEMIQDRMSAVMKSENRGVKQAPFKVLMESTMPAVLVEVGFITNPAESRTISNPETQAKIVAALAQSILAYRDQANARLGFNPTEGK